MQRLRAAALLVAAAAAPLAQAASMRPTADVEEGSHWPRALRRRLRKRGIMAKPHATITTRSGRVIDYHVIRSKPRTPDDRHNAGGAAARRLDNQRCIFFCAPRGTGRVLNAPSNFWRRSSCREPRLPREAERLRVPAQAAIARRAS